MLLRIDTSVILIYNCRRGGGTVENYFAKNLRTLRENKRLSQTKLGELTGFNQTTITRWETGDMIPFIDNVITMAAFFKVSLADMLGREFNIDNGIFIGSEPSVRIPVLGRIPAGVPIEAIEEIVDYVDIDKKVIQSDKRYFGLKVVGDSMYPTYADGDIIIVQQQSTCDSGQDCVVMVNGLDATFKRVVKQNDSIILKPLNNLYEPTVYTLKDIGRMPVTILGIAIEVRRKIV